MKPFILLLLSCISTFGQEQPKFVYDNYPRVFVIPALSLNGGGFNVLSQTAISGASFERAHVMLEGIAEYDNAHKTNDGTINNRKGRSRHLGATTLYRLHNGWFFGAGASWGELATTNYRKQAWHPAFGGGKDGIFDTWSFRIKAMYSLPGSDHVNGVQGPTITVMLPSPAAGGHVFFYESIAISTFHSTITDPQNEELTKFQLAHRSKASYLTLGLMLRF